MLFRCAYDAPVNKCPVTIKVPGWWLIVIVAAKRVEYVIVTDWQQTSVLDKIIITIGWLVIIAE